MCFINLKVLKIHEMVLRLRLLNMAVRRQQQVGGGKNILFFSYTVKPLYNNHPWDPICVAVDARWSFFRGGFLLYKLKMGPQNGGPCRPVVVHSGLNFV